MNAVSTGTESSMKAMESDMIEEMVKDVNDGSVRIKIIVGDEDSTMISKIRTNIDTNIGKTLDANHVKEILRNHLYFVKK
uniref:Mutator-like transposase domain-containing protein n=1 Tax=Magallana gigas TaxID=29159 RepID=A0A8W8JTM1_MAGGI